jgi:hypothetical protein
MQRLLSKRAMFPKRNVGLVVGFTPACAERIADHLIDDSEAAVYAAWYRHVDPLLHDERNPHKDPHPTASPCGPRGACS